MSGTLSRLVLLGAFGVLIQDRGPERTRYFLHAPSDLAAGVRLAVDDLHRDLGRVLDQPVTLSGPKMPACSAGEVHILVAGDRFQPGRGDGQGRALAHQAYAIREERCPRGRRVTLAGGSVLSSQWAVYDLLQRLGIRYFHPEQTYFPPVLTWPREPLHVDGHPSFGRRSIHVHRDHPVELSPPKDATRLDMASHQRRWIDWNVKMRQTHVDGWDADLVGSYAGDRGFTRQVGLNLANAQQGGRPVLDPDDPRGEAVQIREAIDLALRPVPGLPEVGLMSVQFSPSEFTEVDEDLTVQRLELVSRHVTEKYPHVALYTINHGTHQKPTAKRKVRFFDLSAFAPPEMGVMVHPLMFYDLVRPVAGVYGNQTFNGLLEFAIAQQEKRRIVHYPESSWWLTFDLPVPLYLAPATLEARAADLRALGPYIASDDRAPKGIVGHHLFTSGQEWGYWLIDYCVAQMTWDVQLTHQRCLDDFTRILAGGDIIRQVLTKVEARQVRDLRDPELLRFLVGSDDDVETAAGVGVVFHPLPPALEEVTTCSDARVAELKARSLRPLTKMARAYHGFARQVAALLPRQSAQQAPWVRELVDGLEIFALRAEHAVAVYEGALAVRAVRLAGGTPDRQVLSEALGRARRITSQARLVVRRREADYRYPEALTITGGERGTQEAEPNRTIYPYRYLSRTHRLYYWTRPDEQLAALVRDTLAAGQGDVALAPGRRVLFPRGSLKVEAPEEARRLEGLLPGFFATLGDDGASFLELTPLGGKPGSELWRGERTGGRSGPMDFPLGLRRLGNLFVRDALVDVETKDAARQGAGARLRIRGHLKTDEVVALMVKAGGFDAPGARVVLALALGYTPAGLPDSVPIAIVARGDTL